ncbi:MAG: DUF3857 domain-containing protein [Phycisphaerae bacterium]|nr:DUF3857 domain-containing protein [Phycisphaerae bacterium]
MNDDNSIVYHNKQHLRLNSDRTYREFADPRITVDVDNQELEVLMARTRLPDGSYVDLPDYAHVVISPDASAGWPAYASIRQHVFVMSGIEPGCVLELEYKITSKSGARWYLGADVRLDQHYPVREHQIQVQTPDKIAAQVVFRGLSRQQMERAIKGAGHGGAKLNEQTIATTGMRAWIFSDLPDVPDDPNSPPWRVASPRFAFCAMKSTDEWVEIRLLQINKSACELDLISKLTKEWTQNCTDPSDKLRALQENLAASFNFVNFPIEWRTGKMRSAAHVIKANYGLPDEAAAVFLSLALTANVHAWPALLVADHVWLDEAPQDSMVAAYPIFIEGPDGPEIWDAQHGRIVRDSHWAGHTLMWLTKEGVRRYHLPAWTDADESRCRVQGKVTIDEDGTYAGELSLRTTGLFVSPEKLRTGDAQKSRVKALLKRVLPDVEVENYSVEALGAGVFEVAAQVKSSAELKKWNGSYCLQLAEDGPFMAAVPLPLPYSTRTNPVWLRGAFDEQIELTIEWPEGWTVEAQPHEVASAAGERASMKQEVKFGDNNLTVTRHTRVTERQLLAEDFLTLREALNELRSEHARTLLLKP